MAAALWALDGLGVRKAESLLKDPSPDVREQAVKLAPVEASRHLDAARGLCAMRIGGWSPSELLHQQAMEQGREREEGVRVAYVAATRARDLLVVPAVGDEPFDGGWVSPLDPAIYPIEDDQQFAYELLAEQKVLIVQGTGFNWHSPDHLRVVFLPNSDDLTDAIGRIATFLEHYRSRHARQAA